MGYLDLAGLQYLWDKLKEKFAPKNHSHDDRYYTEAEMDGRLDSKVNNNETGANALFSKLTTSWDATPTDDTYFIRQDINGANQFGRVKFSTIWAYIRGKTDGIYQPKGSYAASEHTHDDRYYTEREVDGKLNEKAVSKTLSKVDLNTVKIPGFYNAGGGNGCTNVPVSDAFGLIVIHNAGGEYYTQIFFLVNKNTSYRRYCNGGTWTKWTQDKLTDTNTWRGIQNNLTSDSTSDSLSAAQGKALKGLVDGKAPNGHTHNSIKDIGNNSSNTTFAYSKAGMNYGDYTWLAGWNGYELRAVNKSQFATAGHTHAQTGITGKPELYTKAEVNTLMKKAMYSEGKLVGTGNVTYSYNSNGTLVVPSTSDYIKIVSVSGHRSYSVPINTKMIIGTTLYTNNSGYYGKIIFDTNGKITCVGFDASSKSDTCTYYIEAYQYY